MELKDIILRIGYFRNELKLSARELSLRIGKHEGYINKLESNDFNLPTKILLEIIKALEITEEQFFSSNYMNYKQDNELYEIVKKLPKDKKESLINIIKWN